jgi:hypothetical protein
LPAWLILRQAAPVQGAGALLVVRVLRVGNRREVYR